MNRYFTLSRSAMAAGLVLLVASCGQDLAAKAIAAEENAVSNKGPATIVIDQPEFGFNVLPGSVRRVFARTKDDAPHSIQWSASGGAKLSSTTGDWVDVTAPGEGSSCSFKTVEDHYSVHSATQFTVTAQLQENPNQTSSITINVCKPSVQVSVVPFYTTLYADQKADLQAFVWGSVDRNVTWSITSQPNGGDALLMDAANEDTVFSATVPGRYTLTATSVADKSKRNTATIFVTGHRMPYLVTPSRTMPVDCTVDPSLSGKVYEIGPSQAYKTIQSVPWTALKAGSTVRIHNEDISGAAPTTYHEYFQVTAHGTRTQPVRVCGVPDARGNLPIIDADASTGRPDVSAYSAGYAVVGVGNTGWAGVYTGNWGGAEYLIVEGLRIQNAKAPSTFTKPGGGAPVIWGGGAACVRIFPSSDTVLRGIDAYNCGNGFFSDFNSNNGFAMVANTLYEGNHLHNNGTKGSFLAHQLYIQGWNEVVQFNIVDDYQQGAQGTNLKGRGFPEIVRYNHFGDGAARQLDMVDNQDAYAYTTFEGYLGKGSRSYRATYAKDSYTADLLAAAVEAHHADYVYGNTFVNSTAGSPIHYSTDHGSGENDRIGTLWFYSNSFYVPLCKGCPNWRWRMFDTSGGGGNDFPEIEWPQIQVLNNAIWMDSPQKPYFYWNKENNQFTVFGKNVINANWGSGKPGGGDGTGWEQWRSRYAFHDSRKGLGSMDVSHLIGVNSPPFDLQTFAPNPALSRLGAELPPDGPRLPVRFQYGPSAVLMLRLSWSGGNNAGMVNGVPLESKKQ